MLMTVKEARAKLESAADGMSDEEVKRLIQDLEALARLCLDMYIEKKASERVANDSLAL